MDGVGTPIIERPRPLPGHDTPNPTHHTLNYEEPGNVVHYAAIKAFIEELGTRYDIREIAYDRWGAVQMSQNLKALGFTVVPFGQGFKDMSPPSKELMKLALEGRIQHGGNKVLAWMVDNIHIRTDPADNIKPDRQKSTEKSDGVVALIMALDRAIRNGNAAPAHSVYDERGLLCCDGFRCRGVRQGAVAPYRVAWPLPLGSVVCLARPNCRQRTVRRWAATILRRWQRQPKRPRRDARSLAMQLRCAL